MRERRAKAVRRLSLPLVLPFGPAGQAHGRGLTKGFGIEILSAQLRIPVAVQTEYESSRILVEICRAQRGSPLSPGRRRVMAHGQELVVVAFVFAKAASIDGGWRRFPARRCPARRSVTCWRGK